MGRNTFIAALLLPLPFAALPVVGVLIGMATGPNEVVIDAGAPKYAVPAWDLPAESKSSLAYGVSDALDAGCPEASTSRIEG